MTCSRFQENEEDAYGKSLFRCVIFLTSLFMLPLSTSPSGHCVSLPSSLLGSRPSVCRPLSLPLSCDSSRTFSGWVAAIKK
jgi:hypothetical protein